MNPDNYGSLPACKKLVEVLAKKGIVIETEAAWCEYGPDDWKLGYRGLIEDDPRHRKFIPAYSMPEVWRELPQVIIHDGNNYWLTMQALAFLGHARCGYYFSREDHWCRYFNTDTDPNPTDILISLWIWVLEQDID